MLTNFDVLEVIEQVEEAPSPQPTQTSDWAACTAATLSEAVIYCRSLAHALNATDFGLFFLATSGDARRLVPVFDGEFPGISLLSRSLSSGTARSSLALVAAPTPAWWRPSGEPGFLTANARRWSREVESPGAGTSGIAFPVSVDHGRGGVVVFAGDDMMLDEAGLCETHARCHAVFAGVVRQRTQHEAATPSVSRREIECLRLTASGLTSEEIATTLGLSVHTANQYLTNSTHKLNAVNRIHAVAKALRCGLID